MDSTQPRHIAPAPSPVSDQVAAVSQFVPKPSSTKSGIRRASTACQNCKQIKRKCDQRHPCSNCTKTDTNCVYDQELDGRRRAARKRNVEELELKRDALDTILDALRQSDDHHLQNLLHLIKLNAPLDEILKYAAASEKALPDEHAASITTAIDHNESRKSVLSINALCDFPLFEVPAAPWTTVTNDGGLVSHLVSVYFTWFNPAYPAIDQELFVTDMAAGILDCSFCSPLLVNSVLAMACHFSDHPRTCSSPGDPSTRGQHFLAEAMRLWNGEVGRPSLTNLQAGQPLAVALALSGKDRVSNQLLDQMNGMAQELTFKANRTPNFPASSPNMLKSLSRAAWSLFLVSAGYDLAFMTNKTPSLPQFKRSIHQEELYEKTKWIPYPNREPNMEVSFGELYEKLFALHEIGWEISKLLFGNVAQEEKVNQTVAKRLEYSLETWAKDLTATTELHNDSGVINPLVMDIHLVYHWIRMIFFNFVGTYPLSSKEKCEENSVAYSARAQVVESAQRISTLIAHYLRDFGTKVLTVWMPQTALSAAHMIIDDLTDPKIQRIFHEVCIVITSAARRWPVMRGHVRMLFLTTAEKHQRIPEETRILLKYTALDHWGTEDHKQFDSSIYPNYALAKEQDPRAVAMGELLEQWASMTVNAESSNEFLEDHDDH